MNTHTKRSRAGFTLLEIVTTLCLIALLGALLFPALTAARSQARQAVCHSNLRQVGMAVTQYLQDNDGRYPFAVDPADRQKPVIWSSEPEFQREIPLAGSIHEVLQPYLNSAEIFRCPSDTGFDFGDFNGQFLNAQPTSFEAFETSYYYRTELAQKRVIEAEIAHPAQVNVLFDGSGVWHGSLLTGTPRYNVLFADNHVKTISRSELLLLWEMPFSGDIPQEVPEVDPDS